MNKISKAAFLAVVMGFIFYCYEYLLRIAPSVMQDSLRGYFNIDATLLGTLSAFYYYSYTPMQLVVGVLIDRYDVKKVLFIATLMCAGGTFFVSSSNSYQLASLGRFLQGFGSAFAWVSILKLGAVFLPRKWMGFVSGVGSVFGFLGAAAGQMTMGYVVNSMGWRGVLVCLGSFGIPLAFIIYMMIAYSEKKIGIDTQVSKITNQKINLTGWFSGFLKVAKNGRIWQSGIIAGLVFLPTTVFAELWGVKYISEIYGYTTAQASFVTSMIFLGWALGSLLLGVLSVFITKRMALIRSGVVLALVTSIVMLYVKLPYPLLCLCCVLFGTFSAVEVLTFPMGMEVVSKRLAGTAGSLVNFLCMSSGMIFQRFAGEILDLSWRGNYTADGIRFYSINDYKLATVIIPIALLICAIFTLFVKDKIADTIDLDGGNSTTTGN